MSITQSLASRFSSPGVQILRGTILLLLLCGLVTAESVITGGPNCHRVIPAGTDSHIHLKNYMGSVEVRNGDKDKILITADVPDDCVQIDKGGNMVNIKALKEKGIRP